VLYSTEGWLEFTTCYAFYKGLEESYLNIPKTKRERNANDLDLIITQWIQLSHYPISMYHYYMSIKIFLKKN
jgi:hypothetical protein